MMFANKLLLVHCRKREFAVARRAGQGLDFLPISEKMDGEMRLVILALLATSPLASSQVRVDIPNSQKLAQGNEKGHSKLVGQQRDPLRLVRVGGPGRAGPGHLPGGPGRHGAGPQGPVLGPGGAPGRRRQPPHLRRGGGRVVIGVSRTGCTIFLRGSFDGRWSELGAAAIRDFMGLVPAACEDTGDCVRGEQEYIDVSLKCV